MLRDDALNLYVDGSSFSGPRRGGIGVRIVTIDGVGNEVIEDCPSLGYEAGTNNEMELMACIEGLKLAIKHPVAKATRRIQINTDSRYVSKHWQRTIFLATSEMVGAIWAAD
jgi:ribonuclease HI